MDPMKEAQANGNDDIVALLRQALRFADGGINHSRTPTAGKNGTSTRSGSSGRRTSLTLVTKRSFGHKATPIVPNRTASFGSDE